MSNAARQERLMTVLYGPHMSEKSTIVAEESNQIVFKVRTDASKAEIRQAVELLFEVPRRRAHGGCSHRRFGTTCSFRPNGSRSGSTNPASHSSIHGQRVSTPDVPRFGLERARVTSPALVISTGKTFSWPRKTRCCVMSRMSSSSSWKPARTTERSS